ncbi:MAG TPA: hypothetical protein PK819_10100, partial [Thermomicrobiales bacterium]|nr:hypothetical protein [Thermomicrobiales bacterium]
ICSRGEAAPATLFEFEIAVVCATGWPSGARMGYGTCSRRVSTFGQGSPYSRATERSISPAS